MKSKKPNVLIFFTDQQRWDTSSLFGNKENITPNFDKMAMEGTHCYNAFTPQPVCLPARSCLQTGKYASEMNIFNNGGELQKGSKTLGHYFKEAGYKTGYIGKWHMCHEEPVPKDRRDGYDYWMGANVLEFTSDAYSTYMFDNNGNKKFFPGYRVDAVTDVAIDYLKEENDDPFFLMVSYLEPHFQNSRDDFPAPYGYEEKYIDPWTPPDLRSLSGTYNRHLPGYYGMVKRLDEAFGRMHDALYSLGLLENTIILYTTDHGCHFKTRNSEYKRSCHDSSIRIPMALTGPKFKQGGRLKDLISLIDIPPTLLDACDIDIPDDMMGHSFLPLVEKKNTKWQKDVFTEICDAGNLRRAIRTSRWKYSVINQKPYNKKKPTNYVEEELYDLKADPYELNNLAGYTSHRKLSDSLKKRLVKRMNNIGENDIKVENAKEITSYLKEIKKDEFI